MCARFQMLRQNFSEQRLLGKILRADDNLIVPRATTRRKRDQPGKYRARENTLPQPGPANHERAGCSRRSSTPSRKSAPSASSAAGIAPAKIN